MFFWTLFCGFQLVMNNLQSILENVDTPDLLCQSVKCILQVARCYPHVFSTNFRVCVLAVIGPLAILSMGLSQLTLVKGWGTVLAVGSNRPANRCCKC